MKNDKQKENCKFYTLYAKLNKEFNYDWMNHTTIYSNQNLISYLEQQIEGMQSLIYTLPLETQNELGKLFYKLGTFYLHVISQPHLALSKFEQAKNLLNDVEFAWSLNQMALCYSQLGNVQKSKSYINRIISAYQNAEATDTEAMSILAFSVWISSLNSYQCNEVQSAKLNANFALEMLERINLSNDIYGMVKLSLAKFMAENLQEFAAKLEFNDLENFWLTKEKNKSPSESKISNPYLTDFYYNYAKFLEKEHPEKTELILSKYMSALKNLNYENCNQLQLNTIKNKISEYQNKLQPVLSSLSLFAEQSKEKLPTVFEGNQKTDENRMLKNQ